MKKPAADKRARLPRQSDYTKAFVKDWARLSRSGRFDLGRMKQAMLLLVANDGPLPPEWLDHPLIRFPADRFANRKQEPTKISGRKARFSMDGIRFPV